MCVTGYYISMDFSTLAKEFSRKGVEARTRTREKVCLVCGKKYTARSAKALYCSRPCLTKVGDLKRNDEIFLKLKKIDAIIAELKGINPRIDGTLKKISKLVMLAKMDNDSKLRGTRLDYFTRGQT